MAIACDGTLQSISDLAEDSLRKTLDTVIVPHFGEVSLKEKIALQPISGMAGYQAIPIVLSGEEQLMHLFAYRLRESDNVVLQSVQTEGLARLVLSIGSYYHKQWFEQKVSLKTNFITHDNTVGADELIYLKELSGYGDLGLPLSYLVSVFFGSHDRRDWTSRFSHIDPWYSGTNVAQQGVIQVAAYIHAKEDERLSALHRAVLDNRTKIMEYEHTMADLDFAKSILPLRATET